MCLFNIVSKLKGQNNNKRSSGSIFNRGKQKNIPAVNPQVKAELISQMESYSKGGLIHSFKSGKKQSQHMMKLGIECKYDELIAKPDRQIEFVKLLVIGNHPMSFTINGTKHNVYGYPVGYVMRNIGKERLVFKQVVVDLEGRHVYDRQVANPGETFMINDSAIGYLMALRVKGSNFKFASDNGLIAFVNNEVNFPIAFRDAIRVEVLKDNGIISTINKQFKPVVIVDEVATKIIGAYNYRARRPLKIQKTLIYGLPTQKNKSNELSGKVVGYLITNIGDRPVQFKQRAATNNVVNVTLKPNASHIIHREVLNELKSKQIEFNNASIVKDGNLPYIKLSSSSGEISVRDYRIAKAICGKVDGKLVIDPKVAPYIPKDLLA